MRSLVLMICVCLLLGAAVPAPAAEYPVKPIQVVVPWKPGGGSDISARIIGDHLKDILPQPFVIANIDGAAGLNGALQVFKARPDGYTLLWEHPGNLAVAPMVTKAEFTWKNFDPVCIAAKGDTALIVRKDSPYKTATEALRAIMDAPGKVRWVLAPNAVSHFTFLSISDAVGGLKPMIIPGSGDKDRIVALLGNNGDISTVGYAAAEPYVKSGDLRILAMVNSERSPFAPDIPTLKEQGVGASYDFLYSVFAPKGTPAEVKKLLADSLKKAIDDPATQKALREQAIEPYFRGLEDMAKLWEAEDTLYHRLAKVNGLIQ